MQVKKWSESTKNEFSKTRLTAQKWNFKKVNFRPKLKAQKYRLIARNNMPETVKMTLAKMSNRALKWASKMFLFRQKMRLKNAPDGAEWRREKEQKTAKITSLFRSKKPPLTQWKHDVFSWVRTGLGASTGTYSKIAVVSVQKHKCVLKTHHFAPKSGTSVTRKCNIAVPPRHLP